MNLFAFVKLQSLISQLDRKGFVLLLQTSLSAFLFTSFYLSILSMNYPRSSGRTDAVSLKKKDCKVLAHTIPSASVMDPRSKKEVFQPHLPVRLPCYDLAPVTRFALGRSSRSRTSGAPGFHGLTGGVYKARERIHRAMADARLLANPASRSRVADSDPN